MYRYSICIFKYIPKNIEHVCFPHVIFRFSTFFHPTTMGQLWENYGRTMGQLWDDRRIFADEHVCQELQDDEILTPPVKLRLLLVNFPEDPLQSHEFLVACGENRLDEVEHLLLRPQDPNVVDGEGKGALHIAASNGQLAVVSMCENMIKHVSRQDMLL